MNCVITQNNEMRMCELELGQRVQMPSGYWGRISMFGCDDKGEDRLLVTLQSELGNTIAGAKKGVYPYEIKLTNADFIKGELLTKTK